MAARPLFSEKDWSQVVYYNFDESMTKKSLINIIKKVEESGLRIRYLTCDQGMLSSGGAREALIFEIMTP